MFGDVIATTPMHQLQICSSVGMQRVTDRQTRRRPWPIYISPRLCLVRNVTITFHQNNIGQHCLCLQYIAKLLYCFATAFRRLPKSPSMLSDSSFATEESTFRFHVALEFREFDGKGNFVTCPKDKNVFKLRCNVEKRIVITVLQLSHARELKIERWCAALSVAKLAIAPEIRLFHIIFYCLPLTGEVLAWLSV